MVRAGKDTALAVPIPIPSNLSLRAEQNDLRGNRPAESRACPVLAEARAKPRED